MIAEYLGSTRMGRVEVDETASRDNYFINLSRISKLSESWRKVSILLREGVSVSLSSRHKVWCEEVQGERYVLRRSDATQGYLHVCTPQPLLLLPVWDLTRLIVLRTWINSKKKERKLGNIAVSRQISTSVRNKVSIVRRQPVNAP